jgi:hypothetical protein
MMIFSLRLCVSVVIKNLRPRRLGGEPCFDKDILIG